jgi:hypothetical protein
MSLDKLPEFTENKSYFSRFLYNIINNIYGAPCEDEFRKLTGGIRCSQQPPESMAMSRLTGRHLQAGNSSAVIGLIGFIRLIRLI